MGSIRAPRQITQADQGRRVNVESRSKLDFVHGYWTACTRTAMTPLYGVFLRLAAPLIKGWCRQVCRAIRPSLKGYRSPFKQPSMTA